MRIIYLLIALLLHNGVAEAQTIEAHLVIVRHPLASVPQQRAMFNQGIKRLQETGVTIKVTKVSVISDKLNKNNINSYVDRLYRWGSYAYRHKLCTRGKLCHMLLPPVYDRNGSDYGGGVAEGACTAGSRYNTSYAILRQYNRSGQSRVKSSTTITAHEVGHNVGAEHDDSRANLMHSAALSFGERILPWTKFSKELIDLCLLEEGIRETSRYGFNVRSAYFTPNRNIITEPLRH